MLMAGILGDRLAWIGSITSICQDEAVVIDQDPGNQVRYRDDDRRSDSHAPE